MERWGIMSYYLKNFDEILIEFQIGKPGLEERVTSIDYINEDKSHYKHAKDAGYVDNDDLFLIGDSGGFLMNINPNWKFVNTELFAPAANEYRKNKNK